MAKSSGLGQQFWYHGRNISGDVGTLNSIGSPRGVLDVTGIDAAAFVRLLSHSDGIIDFSGFFNIATDQEHDALSGLRTTDIVATLAMSSTRGATMASLVGKQDGYSLDRGSDGSLSTGAVVLGNQSPLEWGVMITAGQETIASAGSLTGLDENGADASSAFGAVAYLQFLSLASGNPAVLVEDSTDSTNGVDGSWATLLTFVEGTPPLGERKTVTGNVDRWVRATASGTFSNAVVAVGFRRGTADDIIDLS
jgi:hypothetical protein